MTEATIELRGMHFHSPIGCLESEKRAGNDMTVDFSCRCEVSRAVECDELNGTLNYAEVYDIIAEVMRHEANLLEHVAGRILDAVQAAHPELTDMVVKVSKEHPPVNGPVDYSAVTLCRK